MGIGPTNSLLYAWVHMVINRYYGVQKVLINEGVIEVVTKSRGPYRFRNSVLPHQKAICLREVSHIGLSH